MSESQYNSDNSETGPDPLATILADMSAKLEGISRLEKKLEEVLPDAVEQRLRDLPFDMVCAFQNYLNSVEDDSTVTYDRITHCGVQQQ